MVPEPDWEQRVIGGGLWPFCQTRDSSFYMGAFSAAGRAQVPFTLRSLKLSRTFVTLPSPLITHRDLSCWEGQGVFLRKAPVSTQSGRLRNLFFCLGNGKACSDSTVFPHINTYVLAPLGSRLFSLFSAFQSTLPSRQQGMPED